jgi:hypothetical protein
MQLLVELPVSKNCDHEQLHRIPYDVYRVGDDIDAASSREWAWSDKTSNN